jgi:type IV pilus assembly protein PilA
MEQAKKGVPVWVWFLALLPVAVAMLGVLSALAIYGVRKYIVNAKEAEAQATLIAWGDGLAECGEKDGRLPQSALPVPGSALMVMGKKYQSAPSDWNEPAHVCARFSLSTPQYFQYGWEQRSEALGVARATADMTGDGAIDTEFELEVTCSAGKCVRGVPLKVTSAGAAAGVAADSSSAARSASSEPAKAPGAASWLLMGLGGLALLANLVGGVWLIVLAFQQSLMWGLLSLFVPCAQLVFIAQHWHEAKRPALLSLGGSGAFLAACLMIYQLNADEPSSPPPATVAGPAITPPSHSGAGVRLAPPPPHAAVPELTGAPVDLSTVMGKARKLANQWEQDAALVGIETTLVAGVIPTRDDAVAKLTFGPSSFESARPKTGLFVVTYDKTGLTGVPVKGPASKALPEPMCAPELVYARMAEGAAPSLRLRYGFDGSDRPAWIGLLAGQPAAQTRLFDPARCDPMGIVVGPRKR